MRKLFTVSLGVTLILLFCISVDYAKGPKKNIIRVPRDYATIQAAVDAAQPGDTIIVHNGIYNETVTIASDDYDLTLKGEGAVIANDGSLLFGISLQGGCHHISISGFEITGFSGYNYAGIEGWTNTGDPDYKVMSHITIHHNNIHGNYDGINIGAWVWSPWGPGISHHHITIHHNNIHDNSSRGINWWAVADSTIAHNIIRDTAANGINWNGVQDSTAAYNHINGNISAGMSINSSIGNTVAHNDVRNNMNIGIFLLVWPDYTKTTTGNTFIHNDARNNSSWDIFESGAGSWRVFGNTWVKNKYDDASPDPPQ